eukprot:SAG22_NODE_222_length_14768_cov_6.358920_10_plen_157_part_00
MRLGWAVVTGKVNPSGRLPVSWPRSVGGIGAQTPYLQQFQLHHNEAYQDAPSSPFFPFGYGLSYSNFSIGVPVLSTQRCKATDTILDINTNPPFTNSTHDNDTSTSRETSTAGTHMITIQSSSTEPRCSGIRPWADLGRSGLERRGGSRNSLNHII